MQDHNWHNWGTPTLWWVFWIAIVAGLWLIFRYGIKSMKKTDKNKNN